MFLRKGMFLLLALALMIVVLSAACPISAKADGDTVYGVEFAYNNKRGFLTGGSYVWLSEILSAVGLSGRVTSVGGRVVNSKGEVDAFAIYNVLDFTYDSEKDDWKITSPGFLEISDPTTNVTMNVTISGTEYTFALTWLEATISGVPRANGGYVYVNGIKWRVIGVSSDRWLLISADVLQSRINWFTSTYYCETVYGGFSKKEQAAVLSTTKTDFDYKYGQGSIPFKAADLNNEKLFLLSSNEVDYYFVSNNDRLPGSWWLRSLYVDDVNQAGLVCDDGSVDTRPYVNAVPGARPAFVLNRSSILFESAAENGKPAANSGFGTYAEPATSVDRKLTLIDGARSGFYAEANGSAVIAGGTLTVNYSGAATGENEYVSAMLCDSGDHALNYASVTSAGEDAWDLTIPGDLAEGSYTLKVFSEQRNGDNLTDFASAPVEIPLTVTPAYTVTVNNGTGGGNYAEGESVTITASVPETGKQFAGWTGADGLTFTSGSAATATATFTMPASAVEVTAVYEDIRYSIATDGAAQAYYYDSGFNQVFPAEATEGTELSLWVREDATPETGNYFTNEFTLDEEPLMEYDENGGNPRPVTGFTMPAHAVTIGAVQAAQETLALSFAPGETQALPMDAWMQLQYYETAEDEPPLIRYDEATGTEALDVNRDGKPDLQIAFDAAANCVNLARLPDCAAVGEFAFAFSGPTDHYSTITFTLSATSAPTFGTPDFTLPASLTTIEASAFAGDTALTVMDAHSVTAIRAEAFRGCTSLTQIHLHRDCQIDPTAFAGCGTVYVFAPAGGDTQASCASIVNCVFMAETQN